VKAHQIAMLNIRSPRPGAGSGGVPAVTAHDIAGELARFNKRPVQLYTLCLVYWPGGVVHAKHQAEIELISKAAQIWRKQTDDVTHLMLKLEMARTCGDNRKAEVAANQLEAAKNRRWAEPRDMNYVPILRGAAMEFANPGRCTNCRGTGTTVKGTCGACGGSGQLEKTNNARAVACAKHHHTFAQTWGTLYVWFLSELHKSFTKACRIMADDHERAKQGVLSNGW